MTKANQFSSFTTEERNGDPEAVVHPMTGVRYPTEFRPPYIAGGVNLAPVFDPRPEYQFGQLPGNPILVAFRKSVTPRHGEPTMYVPAIAREWLHDSVWHAMFGHIPSDVGYEQALAFITHGRRVLSLITALSDRIPTHDFDEKADRA